MTMNKMEKYDTHEIGFSYVATDEDGETCDFSGSIYAPLDDEMIKICDDEIKEMRYGYSGSQHEWDSYVKNLLDSMTLNSPYDSMEMEDITFDWCEKIDKRSREYKEVA